MKKRNFIVSNDGKYLYITFMGNSKNTGKIYYTNYEPKLYELLKSEIFNSANTNGEGNYIALYYDKCHSKAYFHHIVFCFHYRNLTADNYVDVLADFSDELDKGFEIDHLYEDKYNNCKTNLSLVPIQKNRQKVRIGKKLKFFCDYIEAFDGEHYRMQFTYISSYQLKRIKAIRYYADDLDGVSNVRNFLKKAVKGIRGFNQWELKNSGEGVLLQDNSYSVFGDYSEIRFPKLVAELSIQDLQMNMVDLPLEEFEKKDGSIFENY